MLAGSIEIEISGKYEKFKQDLEEAAHKATPLGEKSGKNFGDGFTTASTKATNRYIEQLKNKLIAATSAMAITHGLAAALEKGAEGANVTESLTAGIKSLPLIGSVYSIFESIGKIITGQTAKEAEIMATQVATKARAARLKADAERRAETANALAGRKNDLTELEGKRRIEMAIRAEDARLVVAKKAELELYQIKRAAEKDLQSAKSEDERDTIKKRRSLEVQMLRENVAFEFQEIEKNEREAAQKKLADDAERSNAAVERIKSEEKAKSDAIEERRERVRTAVGTGQTAFGQFRFSEYTPTEKKAADWMMVEELKRIRSASESALQVAGGFN